MNNGFTHISPSQVTDNIWNLIGKDWMLITAKDPTTDKINTMTASWGCMGILWNKPVGVFFIRPQRYTYGFAESADVMSLSFFTQDYRKALQYCGSHSGRDVDKFAATGLTATCTEDGVPYIEEARLVMVCRKLYTDDLKENCFIDPALLSNYKEKDYHRFYVCEIVDVLVRE